MPRKRGGMPERKWDDLSVYGIHVDPQRPLVTLETASFVTAWYMDGEYVPYANGKYEIPRTFHAVWHYRGELFVTLAIVIERDEPVCNSVLVQRGPASPPLITTSLRLPLKQLVRLSVARAGGPVTVQKDRRGQVKVLTPAVLAGGYESVSEFEAAVSRPQRGKRLEDEHLQRVAEVYRDALKLGFHSPTDEVAHSMFAARSTAGRWVVEARRRGFLGPTTAGRAGEQKKPAKKINPKGGRHGKR